MLEDPAINSQDYSYLIPTKVLKACPRGKSENVAEETTCPPVEVALVLTDHSTKSTQN